MIIILTPDETIPDELLPYANAIVVLTPDGRALEYEHRQPQPKQKFDPVRSLKDLFSRGPASTPALAPVRYLEQTQPTSLARVDSTRKLDELQSSINDMAKFHTLR